MIWKNIIKYTFGGSNSTAIINGRQIIPMELINVAPEILTTGIQVTDDKS